MKIQDIINSMQCTACDNHIDFSKGYMVVLSRSYKPNQVRYSVSTQIICHECKKALGKINIRRKDSIITISKRTAIQQNLFDQQEGV
jgi:hypothetical protein